MAEAIEADPNLRAQVDRIRADNALLGDLLVAAGSAGGDAASPSGPNAAGSRATPPPGAAANHGEATTPATREPVAGYVVSGELGRGGQGIVYRATQTATRRAVALKMLTRGAFAGDRERRRLEREIEVLAGLRHPGVVTVFDGGVTPGGRAWLAMELVEGRRLDAASADLRAAAGPSGRGRDRDRSVATLIRDVTAAVEAAHRLGVMHRDLKPGNVLVDDAGAPRVLDFGLARPVRGGDHAVTETGAILGTLVYAAPEQLAAAPGGVDVRADVFALGVMLFEALAGTRPWPNPTSLADAVERGRTEIAPPSRSIDGLDRDLETIIMRCLAVDPARRYPTAGHLREDLDRFLASRPVLARRESRLHRVRLFVRRHPLASAAATAVVGLAIVSTVMSVRYARALDRNRSFTASLMDMVDATVRDESNEAVNMADVLEAMGGTMREKLPDEPQLRFRMLSTLARAEFDAREYVDAVRTAREALEAGEQAGESDVQLARLHDLLGRVHYAAGDITAAVAAYEAAIPGRIAGAVDADGRAALAQTQAHLGASHRRRGDLDAARPLYREALATTIAVRGAGHLDTAKRRNGYGVLLISLGRDAEAAVQFASVHEIMLATEGDVHIGTATAAHNLGRMLGNLGELAAAEAHLDAALAAKVALDPDDHVNIGRTLIERGRVRRLAGRSDDALVDLDDAVARVSLVPEAAIPLVTALTERGLVGLDNTLRVTGDAADRIADLERAQTLVFEARGPDHPAAAAIAVDLAAWRSITGAPDAAAELLTGAAAQVAAQRAADLDRLRRAAAVADRLVASGHADASQALGPNAEPSLLTRLNAAIADRDARARRIDAPDNADEHAKDSAVANAADHAASPNHQ